MTEKVNYPGGGHRDADSGKEDFSLLFPEGVPYDEQPLVKVARYLTEKAAHYGSRNWEQFHTQEPRDHAQRSQLRHTLKDLVGEEDEPHDVATICNLLMKMTMDYKIRTGWTPDKEPDKEPDGARYWREVSPEGAHRERLIMCDATPGECRDNGTATAADYHSSMWDCTYDANGKILDDVVADHPNRTCECCDR